MGAYTCAGKVSNDPEAVFDLPDYDPALPAPDLIFCGDQVAAIFRKDTVTKKVPAWSCNDPADHCPAVVINNIDKGTGATSHTGQQWLMGVDLCVVRPRRQRMIEQQLTSVPDQIEVMPSLLILSSTGKQRFWSLAGYSQLG